jgi:hypothetical protein
VILTTDVVNLIRDPGMYENRRVELTGRVWYQTTVDPSRWSFFLADKDGNSVRCVEVKHELGTWPWVERIVRGAGMKNDPLTVVGLFDGTEIHLNRVEYFGIPYDTDYPKNGTPAGLWSR